MNTRIFFITTTWLFVAGLCCPWVMAQDEALDTHSWELLSSRLFASSPIDPEVVESGTYSDEWEFMFMPYAQLPSVNYDATVGGVTQSVDLSLGDLLDDFDVFAVAGSFQAWKGNWGIILDSAYVDLDSKFNSPGPTDIKVTIEDWVVNLGLSYRFAPIKLEEEKTYPNLVCSVMGAARYHYLKQDIDFKVLPKVGDSEDWVEPVFGGKTDLNLSEKLRFTCWGNVGGFGIGSASDITISSLAGFGYSFTNRFSLELGYYYTYIDYSRYSGAKKFGLKGYQHGPALGVKFLF